jgi:hypothetical protein
MSNWHDERVKRKQREALAHQRAREIVETLSCYIPEAATGQAIADLAQFLEGQDRDYADAEKLRDLEEGRSVILPCNRAHAEAMAVVAEAFLKPANPSLSVDKGE